jgi:hypothetical protein
MPYTLQAESMKHVRLIQWDGGWTVQARCTCDPRLPHDMSIVSCGDLGAALSLFKRERRSRWSYPFPVHVWPFLKPQSSPGTE